MFDEGLVGRETPEPSKRGYGHIISARRHPMKSSFSEAKPDRPKQIISDPPSSFSLLRNSLPVQSTAKTFCHPQRYSRIDKPHLNDNMSDWRIYRDEDNDDRPRHNHNPAIIGAPPSRYRHSTSWAEHGIGGFNWRRLERWRWCWSLMGFWFGGWEDG